MSDDGDAIDPTEVQRLLTAIGFGPVLGQVDGIIGPRTTEAIWRFQEGYATRLLAVDAECGPLTYHALWQCMNNGGRTSDHFAFTEFAEQGTGIVYLLRELPIALERLRSLRNDRLPIVSGYRGDERNRAVGGANNSAHLLGAAADIPGIFTEQECIDVEAFSGIGVDGATGLVLHVDVRHATGRPDLYGDASPSSPALWLY